MCCDSPCTEQCLACDVPGKLGTCSAVSGAPHAGHGSCAGVVGGLCGQRCDGLVTTACAYPDGTTPCGVEACKDGSETHSATCDAAGKCLDVPKSCGGYGCDAIKCKTLCATKADCTVTCDKDNWEKMLDKPALAMQLFMTRKLTADNVGLATKLQQILG